MMKKKLAAVIMAVTVLAGSTSTPALANTDPAAEQAAYTEYTDTAESTDTSDQTEADSEIVRDSNTDAAQDQNGTSAADPESNAPLTPAGNMTLVDNVTTSGGTKQFLTLTSRKTQWMTRILRTDSVRSGGLCCRIHRQAGKRGMKRLSENKFMMAMPLLLGILSMLCFLLYLWSANHAPYNYVNIISYGPVFSLIGIVITIITRKSRKMHPVLWKSGLAVSLAGFIICVLIILLLAAILIAAANGKWL